MSNVWEVLWKTFIKIGHNKYFQVNRDTGLKILLINSFTLKNSEEDKNSINTTLKQKKNWFYLMSLCS